MNSLMLGTFLACSVLTFGSTSASTFLLKQGSTKREYIYKKERVNSIFSNHLFQSVLKNILLAKKRRNRRRFESPSKDNDVVNLYLST